MSQPVDSKKGAIPLDKRAGEQDEAVQPKDLWSSLVEQMGLTLGYLYTEVKAGRVKALSCVFVDDSGVPQHAFFVAPNQAVPLLAGMMVGTDAVKAGAEKSMNGYRDWLRQQAEAQQRGEGGKPEQANPDGASKPN